MTEHDNSNDIIPNSPTHAMPASYSDDDFYISDYDLYDDLDSEYLCDFNLNNNFIEIEDCESYESDSSDESE